MSGSCPAARAEWARSRLAWRTRTGRSAWPHPHPQKLRLHPKELCTNSVCRSLLPTQWHWIERRRCSELFGENLQFNLLVWAKVAESVARICVTVRFAAQSLPSTTSDTIFAFSVAISTDPSIRLALPPAYPLRLTVNRGTHRETSRRYGPKSRTLPRNSPASPRIHACGGIDAFRPLPGSNATDQVGNPGCWKAK